MGIRRSQTRGGRVDPAPSQHVEPSKVLSIIDAVQHAELFAEWFRDRESWSAWFTFLKCMFGLSLTPSELTVFKACTGRSAPRPGGYLEASLICGRRSGKSLILSLIAVYLACFYSWAPYLVSGERGVITIIATDRRQAGVILRYIKAFLAIPPLVGMIQRETADTIDLDNLVTIEIQTASFRGIRGRTVVAALCDELSFWRDESSANPDTEIIGALRPSMITIPTARLLKASSPYARRGALWDDHRRHFGRDDSSMLVWQAPTLVMNPSVPQAIIDAAYESDPTDASAEYGAIFRSDIESFVDRAAVEACVVEHRYELPPVSGVSYSAFCDPSGGGGSDSMTLAISHREGNVAILDCVREFRPPFSPENCVAEFATLLKSYHVSTVFGDRFAGMWPAERFQKHGIEYNAAVKPKSDIYRDALPIINGARAELLDHARLVSQLCALERKTARGGRDSIDHPPNQHDDVVNAVAGALTNLIVVEQPRPLFGTWGRSYGSSPTTAGGIFASMPPEHWASIGYFHPHDRQRYIDAGIFKSPEATK